MIEVRGAYESPRRRAFVLAGQGFALGLTMAWIMIPASALFLSAYGPDWLPVTYIGAAAAGAGSSTALARALRRLPIATVATRILAGLALALLGTWIVLAVWSADWVCFALLVLIPIVVPVGFVFLVGQAGLLLDVRALKALYARVVAGFALGFVAGGLAGPALLTVLGRTENLLAAAAAAAVFFLVLVVVTRRRYPDELAVVEHAEGDTARPTIRSLASNRFLALLVAFQMLSAVESQWLDFLVFDRAAQRYHDSTELAEFVSRFSAIAYGADILFLLLVAGLLLRRFGLRYGLAANSVGVLMVVVAVVLAGSLQGSMTTVVFVLIVAARVTDLTLSDGAARTSMSAAYQAVPSRLRAVTQAAVEGFAVPMAIGASGVVLLVLRAAGVIDGMVLPLLTAVVVTTWTVVAVLAYREYRVSLLANLRGRTLDQSDLALEGEGSLVAIDRLVGSDDERDVRLGLDILTRAEHPELIIRLERLVDDTRVNVRTDALERLVRLDARRADVAARHGLADPSPRMRAASMRALGALAEPADLDVIELHAHDPDPDVQVAAVFALTRVGDAAVRARVASEIAGRAAAEDPSERVVAARMLGEFEGGGASVGRPLGGLLADVDHDVGNAALDALRWPEDVDLLPDAVERLRHRMTAGAATDALVRAGDLALTVMEDAVLDPTRGRRVQELAVKVMRDIGGPSAIAGLHRHAEHPDREIGLAVMHALAALGSAGVPDADRAGPNPEEQDRAGSALARADLEHAARVLQALTAFDDEPAAALQCAALRDELDLVRRRVLAALSMRHGIEGIHRVTFHLVQHDARSHALALEWLDVTLTGTDRAVIPMLEPGLSERAQLHTLTQWFPLPPLGRHEILLDLVADHDDRWRRPWLTACAVWTAAAGSDADLDAVTTAASARLVVSDGAEWSILAETVAGVTGGRPRAPRGSNGGTPEWQSAHSKRNGCVS